MKHGYVPVKFGSGVIVPIIKERLGDATKLDNYRVITIGSCYGREPTSGLGSVSESSPAAIYRLPTRLSSAGSREQQTCHYRTIYEYLLTLYTTVTFRMFSQYSVHGTPRSRAHARRAYKLRASKSESRRPFVARVGGPKPSRYYNV